MLHLKHMHLEVPIGYYSNVYFCAVYQFSNIIADDDEYNLKSQDVSLELP